MFSVLDGHLPSGSVFLADGIGVKGTAAFDGGRVPLALPRGLSGGAASAGQVGFEDDIAALLGAQLDDGVALLFAVLIGSSNEGVESRVEITTGRREHGHCAVLCGQVASVRASVVSRVELQSVALGSITWLD